MYHTYCFIQLLHDNFPSNNDKNITIHDFKKKLHNSCIFSSLFFWISFKLWSKQTSATHSMSVCLYLDIKKYIIPGTYPRTQNISLPKPDKFEQGTAKSSVYMKDITRVKTVLWMISSVMPVISADCFWTLFINSSFPSIWSLHAIPLNKLQKQNYRLNMTTAIQLLGFLVSFLFLIFIQMVYLKNKKQWVCKILDHLSWS